MSKNDVFIKDFLLPVEQQYSYDPYINEITKKEYELLLINKKYTSYIKDLDIYQNINNQPFPLFKVHIIKDYQNSYESGSKDWEFEFIFKHKGKYYRFIDYGST